MFSFDDSERLLFKYIFKICSKFFLGNQKPVKEFIVSSSMFIYYGTFF